MTASDPIGPATILRRKPRLTATEMDGRTVMMDTQHGSYFALDPVGGAVWEMLEEPASVAAVVAHIAQSFDAPDPAELQRDLTDFLSQMVEQGLAEKVAEG